MESELNYTLDTLEDALSKSRQQNREFEASSHITDISVTLADHEFRYFNQFIGDSKQPFNELLQDQTLTGEVIHSENLCQTSTNSLYTKFFEIYQRHSASTYVLEVLADTAQCCSDVLHVLNCLRSKVTSGNVEEGQWLELERDTWKLLHILYADRLVSQELMDNDGIVQYFGKSERLCVENLFKRESLVRECQLIIDWLEAEACEREDQEGLCFSDSTMGWENTLHQLQSTETIAFGSSKQIITKMDPDAPKYQKKSLHDLDEEDDRRLNKCIFREIRSGKLEEVGKLARQYGHPWKTAMFEGWRLFHNPNIKEDNYEIDDEQTENYEQMNTKELKDIEGNRNRDIWKLMAFKYCKQDKLNLYEKASIGTYCGYIDAILPVCNSWYDNLWAYMKSMVDIRVESELRDSCSKEKGYRPMPDEYWMQRTSLDEVFKYLESSKSAKVRAEAKERQHVIQKYIILDQIPKLLTELENWVQEVNAPTQVYRFAAHIVLFFDVIGYGESEKIEKILTGYIERLMQMKETLLVAFYSSKVNSHLQIRLYAQYLENITDREQRLVALEYGKDCGLNTRGITKQIVENIRNRPNQIDSGSLQEKLTDNDKLMISSIEWLTFDDLQKSELLLQSNCIIFKFLALGKLDAAHLAFNKVPEDCVKLIVEEIGETNDEINKAIKEHLCYKVYLEAYESFNKWFSQHKSKPIEPEPISDNADFLKKVAHEHRVSKFNAETERWKLSNEHLASVTKTLLFNILLFPDGWLVDTINDSSLRKIVIPDVTFLLCSVLHDSGLHSELVSLADTIASEEYYLYKEFTKEQLCNLLMKISGNSMELITMRKDAWGYDITA